MDEKARKIALDIMNRLMKHPMTQIFKERLQLDDPYINLPILPDVISKLKKNQYKTVREWTDDIEAVWENAEYYEQQQYTVTIASECRHLFSKFRREIDVLSLPTWRSEVYRLRSRVYDLMGQPPAKVKQYASSLGAAHTMRQNMPVLTDKEIQLFIAASEMMTLDDQTEMLKIIDEMQPEIDPGTTEISLDVTKINLPTIYALREYMKTALEKEEKNIRNKLSIISINFFLVKPPFLINITNVLSWSMFGMIS